MLKVGSIVWGVRDVPRSIEFWAAALDYSLREPATADPDGNRFCVVQRDGPS
jgi:hypothetical protein